MDHQHFENYLLNDTPIPREEKAAFDAHLKVCARCASLVRVNRSLNHVVMAAPTTGFATRFQVRLATQRKAERKRHLFGLLILLFGGIALGSWYALPFLSIAFFSPTVLLMAWAQTLSAAISLVSTLIRAANVIGRVATDFIPAESVGLALVVFSLFVVGWMLSIQKSALSQSV